MFSAPFEALPQSLGIRKTRQIAVFSGEEVMLDDALAIRRIGKLQPQNLGVLLGLLKPVSRAPV